MDNKKPLVLVDRGFPQLEIPSVLINNYEICYQSTKQLIESGIKNPGFISYKQDQFHTNERERGFVEAIKEAGLYNTDNVKKVSYENLSEDMDKAVEELLQCKRR